LLLGLAHHGNFVCVADKTVHVMVRKWKRNKKRPGSHNPPQGHGPPMTSNLFSVLPLFNLSTTASSGVEHLAGEEQRGNDLLEWPLRDSGWGQASVSITPITWFGFMAQHSFCRLSIWSWLWLEQADLCLPP
jgi:hypothetical protein